MFAEIDRIAEEENPGSEGTEEEWQSKNRRERLITLLGERLSALKPRKLLASEVEFEEGCEEEFIPVEGYMATDDYEADRANEKEILDRLNRGDNSAWCILVVKAKWKGHVEHASLGCFVFPEGNSGPANKEYAKDEYENLKIEALEALNQEIQSTFEGLSELL